MSTLLIFQFFFFRPSIFSLLDRSLFHGRSTFLISGPSTFTDRPLCVFWTVNFGQKPRSRQSQIQRILRFELSWTESYLLYGKNIRKLFKILLEGKILTKLLLSVIQKNQKIIQKLIPNYEMTDNGQRSEKWQKFCNLIAQCFPSFRRD